ncbi:DNA topoisomerase VI subunit A, partial [Candidatus Haloredivivus sp. G17]
MSGLRKGMLRQEYLTQLMTESLKVIGLDENTFEDQDESNNVVVDIETATGAIREDLHLFAEPKGRLFGPIKIND